MGQNEKVATPQRLKGGTPGTTSAQSCKFSLRRHLQFSDPHRRKRTKPKEA